MFKLLPLISLLLPLLTTSTSSSDSRSKSTSKKTGLIVLYNGDVSNCDEIEEFLFTSQYRAIGLSWTGTDEELETLVNNIVSSTASSYEEQVLDLFGSCNTRASLTQESHTLGFKHSLNLDFAVSVTDPVPSTITLIDALDMARNNGITNLYILSYFVIYGPTSESYFMDVKAYLNDYPNWKPKVTGLTHFGSNLWTSFMTTTILKTFHQSPKFRNSDIKNPKKCLIHMAHGVKQTDDINNIRNQYVSDIKSVVDRINGRLNLLGINTYLCFENDGSGWVLPTCESIIDEMMTNDCNFIYGFHGGYFLIDTVDNKRFKKLMEHKLSGLDGKVVVVPELYGPMDFKYISTVSRILEQVIRNDRNGNLGIRIIDINNL